MSNKRSTIKPSVREEVLREAGYKCGNPTCRNILTLQLHHIVWVKEGGDNTPINLIALCGHCHDMHTQGHIPSSAIKYWRGLLHALNHAFNKESIDLLLYLNNPSVQDIWYSGDGILKFSSLISAGLVQTCESTFSVGLRHKNKGGGRTPPTSPPTTSVKLELSLKGKTLVESWLKGEESVYLKG